VTGIVDFSHYTRIKVSRQGRVLTLALSNPAQACLHGAVTSMDSLTQDPPLNFDEPEHVCMLLETTRRLVAESFGAPASISTRQWR